MIRTGPGAAILPPEVKRIHLDFAIKINDGHAGPRSVVLWLPLGFSKNILPNALSTIFVHGYELTQTTC